MSGLEQQDPNPDPIGEKQVPPTTGRWGRISGATRLATGLINHALGLISPDAMKAGHAVFSASEAQAHTGSGTCSTWRSKPAFLPHP